MVSVLFLCLLPAAVVSQYYNPSLYQSYLGANVGVPRQQTVLVPVYTQGGYGAGYPSYGGMNYGGGMVGGYPGYGMYQGGGYPMMAAGYGGGMCCGGAGGAMMPPRESNAKKFLRGATEGVFMGSVGMLGFRK